MNLNDPVQRLIACLGDEIEDASDETFDLFSHFHSTQDLGMVNAKAEELDISIADRDFTIKQSPGVLRSNREGGTTGAVVWRASVQFAECINFTGNPLFEKGALDSESSVIELGSGISGLVPLMLSDKVKRVVATDQQYALKLLQENISTNTATKARQRSKHRSQASSIDVLAVDWETHDIASFLRTHGFDTGFDGVFVCDCVFNYALIAPLVETCTSICRARGQEQNQKGYKPTRPTLCVIAQQLRQPDVFEEWLHAFLKEFHTWRIPSVSLHTEAGNTDGLVVHLGILR